MKTSNVLLVLVVAVLAAPVPRLVAQASNNTSDLAIRQFSLDLLDKQAREASEREEARKQAVQLSAATYDANHDGKLDATEFAAWEKQVRTVAEKSPRVLKKFDKNNDKKLDDTEWAAARKGILPN